MMETLVKLIPEDRTPEQRARDQQKAELKARHSHKVTEIECYFDEIYKLQRDRSKLITKGKGESGTVHEQSQHISEGLSDLENEIEILKKILVELGEPLTQAESFNSRCSLLKFQEDTDGYEGNGKVTIKLSKGDESELQDFSTL